MSDCTSFSLAIDFCFVFATGNLPILHMRLESNRDYIYILLYSILCIVCVCGAIDGKANHIKGRNHIAKICGTGTHTPSKEACLSIYSQRDNDNGHPLVLSSFCVAFCDDQHSKFH